MNDDLAARLDFVSDLFLERLAEIYGTGQPFDDFRDAFQFARLHPDDAEARRVAELGLSILKKCKSTTAN